MNKLNAHVCDTLSEDTIIMGVGSCSLYGGSPIAKEV